MNRIVEIIRELENTPGTNDKIAIISNNKENEIFKKILQYTYDGNLNYGFSESKLRLLLETRQISIIRGLITKWDNVFDMLDELAASNINDDLRGNVVDFLLMQSDDIRELYIRVLTKDLRCNISSKTCNKAIPKLITEWEIQQGHPLEKVKLKDNEWIALSLKLNGIRTTLFKDQFTSRQNKPMTGYDHIKEDISKLEDFKGYVFDGELVRKNVDNLPDNENFRLTTSIVNSDAKEKPEIQLVIFDLLPTHEFINGQSSKTFKERLEDMNKISKLIDDLGLKNISVAPLYYIGTDHSAIDKYLDLVDAAGLEGLMLLRNMPYKCKRHNGVLKCKKFKEGDMKVVGFEEGSGKNKNMLGSLIVEYKGNQVGVGSGFSDAQRIDFWNNKESMIGKIITVKYKEETMDKKTKLPSLQFPIFVMVRDDKSEPNY